MHDVSSRRKEGDYALLARLSLLDDTVLIGPTELAALMGYSVDAVQQKRVPTPPRVQMLTRLRWRMGDYRKFIAGAQQKKHGAVPIAEPKKIGRPTKAAEIQARRQAESAA